MGFVSTSKLAKMLDAPESELTDAVREERECGGYPVWEWAEREDDTIYGFEVPQELLQDLARERDLSTGLFGL